MHIIYYTFKLMEYSPRNKNMLIKSLFFKPNYILN